MERHKCLSLFTAFFKIGLFTFGGGYAMIPMIQKEIVENKKWISNEDILDVVAIAEITPGPIAVNAATFVGYKCSGVMGAAAATFGVVLPSFGIIVLIAALLAGFRENPIVQNAFWGIRIGVLALIVKALVTMAKQCPKRIYGYVIAAASFVSVAFFHINVLIVIAVAACAGLICDRIRRKEENHDLS